jgi:NAD dependent epimerase/dehydratase family enzyme
MSVPQRIAITGASGLIGSALVGHLKSEGHTVQRLVRRATVAPDEIQWDPKTGFVDIEALRGVDAVIHLAGVGVGDKRWTKRYKSEILNSRLLGTTAIANAVAEVKPQVFISASGMEIPEIALLLKAILLETISWLQFAANGKALPILLVMFAP